MATTQFLHQLVDNLTEAVENQAESIDFAIFKSIRPGLTTVGTINFRVEYQVLEEDQSNEELIDQFIGLLWQTAYSLEREQGKRKAGHYAGKV